MRLLVCPRLMTRAPVIAVALTMTVASGTVVSPHSMASWNDDYSMRRPTMRALAMMLANLLIHGGDVVDHHDS